MFWPFVRCKPPPADPIREAAPEIARKERELAELRLKRVAMEHRITGVLDEIATRSRRREEH